MNRHDSPAALALLLLLPPALAHADDTARIVAATVFPDGATVTRELRSPGGTRHVLLSCLPAAVDLSTLHVEGPADLHVGEVRSEPVLATEADACGTGPLATQLKALSLRAEALDNQLQAGQMALQYLGRYTAASGPMPATGPAAGAAAGAGALRGAAQDLLATQARLKHEKADVDAAVATLQQAIAAAPHAGNDGWRHVHVDVATAGPATLKLSYQVRDAHWRPAYRAALDTTASTLRLERQAEITQATGEDWTGVALVLSTGLPRRAPQGPVPQPWRLEVRQRVEITGSSISRVASTPVIAPAPMAPTMDMADRPAADGDDAPADIDDTPVPEVAASETAFETEFTVSQPVSFASDGQRHLLALEALALPVSQRLRATPRQDPAAYLLAEAARPAGVWPAGAMQLWRDGRLVGRTTWQPDATERFTLPFGRDDRVTVAVEEPAQARADTGLFGRRTERRWERVYAVTNGHATPVTVELLDAAPVSQDAAIDVKTTFQPAPDTREW